MKGVCKIIGCRAGSPADGIPASGYLLKCRDGNILMDCGPGVVLSLTREEIDNLKGVIISHQHADHTLDLMTLAFYLLFPAANKKVPLFGPPSVIEMLSRYDSLFGISSLPSLRTPVAAAFDLIPVKPGNSFTIVNSRFDTLPMKHPVETMAIRSRELKLVYTADGAHTSALDEFCKGDDYLLAEATYAVNGSHDLEGHGHMTAQICASLAQAAGINHLVIIHLSDYQESKATLDTAKQYFNGRITLASPGLEIMCN